ncbi:hypothetical protein Micbo1qcDRAFT_177166 [Microdochium bolleyi]|uniref:Uncharacterized protein n=1 Tax=Microdochium bolleyi TaxID=196109 RepID=A0A136IWL4_9PEZI|nr:hypothetical protein Micbo1qcDRAFT_177166 [Microdochium bolleyi]
MSCEVPLVEICACRDAGADEQSHRTEEAASSAESLENVAAPQTLGRHVSNGRKDEPAVHRASRATWASGAHCTSASTAPCSPCISALNQHILQASAHPHHAIAPVAALAHVPGCEGRHASAEHAGVRSLDQRIVSAMQHGDSTPGPPHRDGMGDGMAHRSDPRRTPR